MTNHRRHNIFEGRGRSVRRRRRRRRSRLFAALIVLLGLIAISRWFAGAARGADLIANVSYFIVPLTLLFLIFALFGRRWISSVCLLAITFVAGWPIAAGVLAAYSAPARSSVQRTSNPVLISVLVINADGDAEALERLALKLTREEPDLVAIIEAGHETGRAFLEREDIAAIYPYGVEPDRSIMYSIALLSRHPLTRITFEDDPTTTDEETYAWHHSYFVDLPNDAQIVFTAAHPPSPRTRESWDRGNEKLEALAHLMRSQVTALDRPILLAGDFNTTVTGYRHRIMRTRSGLVSSDEILGGIRGTWPAQLPAPLRLALDRIWISPADSMSLDTGRTALMSRRVDDTIGSDHRPVWFKLMVE